MSAFGPTPPPPLCADVLYVWSQTLSLLLSGKNKKKQKLDDFETSALRRYEEEKGAEVKTRGLLPIKTRKGGIIMQQAEVSSKHKTG